MIVNIISALEAVGEAVADPIDLSRPATEASSSKHDGVLKKTQKDNTLKPVSVKKSAASESSIRWVSIK